MKFSYFLSILAVAVVGLPGYPAFSTSGPGEGGGGASSEMGVDLIRADILKWVINGSHPELNLPQDLNYQQYADAMTPVLAPQYVVVTFVTKDEEEHTTDPEKQVIVDGQPKDCRGFVSIRDNRPHILCSTERYPKGGADQYRLIHHEYAGLAGVEKNVGASSDYFISEQITKYLRAEMIFRLGMEENDAPLVAVESSVSELRPGDRMKLPNNFPITHRQTFFGWNPMYYSKLDGPDNGFGNSDFCMIITKNTNKPIVVSSDSADWEVVGTGKSDIGPSIMFLNMNSNSSVHNLEIVCRSENSLQLLINSGISFELVPRAVPQ